MASGRVPKTDNIRIVRLDRLLTYGIVMKSTGADGYRGLAKRASRLELKACHKYVQVSC